MDQTLIFITIILIILAILLISVLFSKRAIVRRKLKNAAIKRITGFIDGESAKIIGKVEFVDEPLLSPLSGRECAYYYIHVEQKVSTGKSSHWKTVIEEEKSCKFVIREGINCAYLSSHKIKSYIVQDKNYTSGVFNDATEHLEKYLNAKGFKSEGFLGLNKTLRYKEGVLENGEEIAVFGKGEWKDVNELGLPDKYGRVLAITSPDGEAVYLSDDPKAI